jgi:hypothetical protein
MYADKVMKVAAQCQFQLVVIVSRWAEPGGMRRMRSISQTSINFQVRKWTLSPLQAGPALTIGIECLESCSGDRGPLPDL